MASGSLLATAKECGDVAIGTDEVSRCVAAGTSDGNSVFRWMGANLFDALLGSCTEE